MKFHLLKRTHLLGASIILLMFINSPQHAWAQG